MMPALAACQTTAEAPPQAAVEASAIASSPSPAELKYFPSTEPLRTGLDHFHRGHHGLATRYFQDAVEKAPRNPAAWIALAASYDHIKRFDLADKAYKTAIQLAGETAQILNNQGYSYMLRGDYRTAHLKFQRANRRDPGNPTITNNMEILRSQYPSGLGT